MKINPRHLKILKNAADPQVWSGSRPLSWANWVGGATVAPFRNWLDDKCPSREELVTLCGRRDAPLEAAFLAVMAWGGMHRMHGKRAWKARQRGLLATMEWVKKRSPHPEAAFRSFQLLKERGDLPGIGPAYFTKLIFFLAPKSGGYILDQWTAKSTNLLFGPLVHLTVGSDRGRDTVSNRNTEETYGLFCKRIDQLAKVLPCKDGAEAERLIFSQQRPTAKHWRHYVKKTWDPVLHNHDPN